MLAKQPGCRNETAHALGMSRTTLWRRMKRYGISELKGET
jgi:transcriptional regulator of acetoin/glycerol metabolism